MTIGKASYLVIIFFFKFKANKSCRIYFYKHVKKLIEEKSLSSK